MLRLSTRVLFAIALCTSPSLAQATTTAVDYDEADLFVEAPADDQKMGMATHIADLDDDGYDDILFSAPGVDLGTDVDVGEVYIYFGPISDYNTAYHPPGGSLADPDITISGTEDEQGLGTRIKTGDIDDDGELDVVLSAMQAGGSGEAYVFLGPLSLGTDLDTDDADVVLQGGAANDGFGHELVVADLDGDGYDDVVVGAPNESTDAGEVYIYWGDSSLGSSSTLSPDVTFSGHGTIATGSGLAAGDLGLGNLTLAIGSPRADSQRGKVHLFTYDSASPWTDDSVDGGQADVELLCTDLHSACGLWERPSTSSVMSWPGTISPQKQTTTIQS